jgi:hypothetical protein
MLHSQHSQRTAWVLLSTFIAVALADHALAENVLILSQGSFFTIASQDNIRLQNVLQAYGNSVKIGGPYATFDGTELEGQDVVVLPQFDVPDMPIAGQQALVDFVSRGGGLIANAFTYWKWTARNGDYFVLGAGLERMGRLLPVQRISFPYIIETETLTLIEATPEPVLMSGIPPSFSFWVGTENFEQGTQALLVPQLVATVFYASAGSYSTGSYSSLFRGTLGLVGWRFGNGHVLQFSTTFAHELADETFGHLLANAVQWAGHANRGPLVTELRFDRGTVGSGESVAATFLGEGLTDSTYFDVRFRVPGSTTNEMTFNWQQGTSVRHTVPLGTGIGEWTVTGVRAHQNIDDHTAEFDPVSALLTVSP